MKILKTLLTCFFLLFSVVSFAQAVDQTADQKVELRPGQQNIKALYEQAQKQEISVAEFKSLMETTDANLEIWKNVSKYFKEDDSVDKSYLTRLIDGMSAKLETLDK